MFDAIAPRYDFLNHLLSFGIDRSWRRKAVDLLSSENPERILDVATGTGDLAIEALHLKPQKVVGVDIAEKMLSYARQKVARTGQADRVVFTRGDAERLPFSDNQFHAALVGFGVRNFQDLNRGLTEIRRVLCPGGRLVVLEFSQPSKFPVKQAYTLYSRYVLPLLGRILSGHTGPYRYLPASIAVFPSGEQFLTHMQNAGYVDVSCRELTFGIVSLYSGRAGSPGKLEK